MSNFVITGKLREAPLAHGTQVKEQQHHDNMQPIPADEVRVAK